MIKFEYIEILEPKYNRNKKQLQEHLDKLKTYFEKYGVKNISITETRYSKLAYKVKNHTKGFFIIFKGEILSSKKYWELEKKIYFLKNKKMEKEYPEILKNFICRIEE